jgi:hypothetical protein
MPNRFIDDEAEADDDDTEREEYVARPKRSVPRWRRRLNKLSAADTPSPVISASVSTVAISDSLLLACTDATPEGHVLHRTHRLDRTNVAALTSSAVDDTTTDASLTRNTDLNVDKICTTQLVAEASVEEEVLSTRNDTEPVAEESDVIPKHPKKRRKPVGDDQGDNIVFSAASLCAFATGARHMPRRTHLLGTVNVAPLTSSVVDDSTIDVALVTNTELTTGKSCTSQLAHETTAVDEVPSCSSDIPPVDEETVVVFKRRKATRKDDLFSAGCVSAAATGAHIRTPPVVIQDPTTTSVVPSVVCNDDIDHGEEAEEVISNHRAKKRNQSVVPETVTPTEVGPEINLLAQQSSAGPADTAPRVRPMRSCRTVARTFPMGQFVHCSASFLDSGPLTAMFKILEGLLDKVQFSFIGGKHECEMTRATQDKFVPVSTSGAAPKFQGLYFKCMDTSLICILVGKIAASSVYFAPNVKSVDTQIVVPLGALSNLLTSVEAASHIQLYTSMENADLMIKTGPPMQSRHHRTFSINCMVPTDKDYDISKLEFDFTLDFDLRTLQKIIRMAHTIQSEFIRFRIMGMVGSKRTFLVINTKGSTAMDENVFTSTTTDQKDGASIIVVGADDTIDFADPDLDPANVDTADLAQLYTGVFVVKYLNQFLRNLEQPVVLIRVAKDPNVPMIITSYFGDEHSFVTCILSGKLDNANFTDAFTSFKQTE